MSRKVINEQVANEEDQETPRGTLKGTGEGTREVPARTEAYIRYVKKTSEELYEAVEYDMDEEDIAWLELVNEQRSKHNLSLVSHDMFELLLDRFEKESFFQRQSNTPASISSSTTASVPDSPAVADDDDAVCAVCLDGDCYHDNVILFCDMCNLAVHQVCYGVPHIPAGSWLCRRCLYSPSKSVDCCLCPSKTGAMKPVACEPGAKPSWAHVACAYWIPEVGFASIGSWSRSWVWIESRNRAGRWFVISVGCVVLVRACSAATRAATRGST